jgi:5-methyltetrahydropteroyltriglutamate--homocysteine methyltransferase
MSVTTAGLGFPRIGPRRELKFALERYWSGRTGAAELRSIAARLRGEAWSRQRELGLGHIPSNDFSLYDHVLDASVAFGAVPAAYRRDDPLETYFAMARGERRETCCGGAQALEMTKWFDTNYHFLTPEFVPGQVFDLVSPKGTVALCAEDVELRREAPEGPR